MSGDWGAAAGAGDGLAGARLLLLPRQRRHRALRLGRGLPARQLPRRQVRGGAALPARQRRGLHLPGALLGLLRYADRSVEQVGELT